MAESRSNTIKAENAVIGCLLIDPSSIDGLNLSPDMFLGVYQRRIFEEFFKSKGERLDNVLLRSRIPESEIPDDMLNRILGEAVSIPVFSSEIGKYAALVFEDYRTRMLRTLASPEKTNAEMITELESLTFCRPAVSIAQIAAENMGVRFSPNNNAGMPTGFGRYDAIMGGLRKGKISVIAARTSVGKSALALEIAINMAKAGVKVRYVSTEMSHDEIYERLVAHESGIVSTRIQNADHFSNEQEAECFEAGNESLFALKNLTIDDDVFDIDEVIAGMVGYDVVFIDYIQEFRQKGSRLGRDEQLANICVDLRIAAKRQSAHVVLLSQLNRYVKDTDEPDIEHLAESDAIGRSASQITMLWNLDESQQLKGIKIAKNRGGRKGKISMKFDGAVNHFSELSNSANFKKVKKDDETPFS